MGRRGILVAAVVAVVAAAGGLVAWRLRNAEEPGPPATSFAAVVPAPVSATAAAGVTFTLRADAPIVSTPGSDDAARVGAYLADLISAPKPHPAAERADGGIAVVIDPALADEAYQLDIDARGVTIRAGTGAGLFWGVQTLRQLMPTKAPFVLPGGRISDRPRFAYRGVMLDVARHFFGVADVERVIDLAAMYKINYLHLHLSDDQGWRIAVDAWPRLSTYGGGTEVGDGTGGFYTKDDYRKIVAYAAARYVTVVPEIDLPGHTNAALASYPELNCNGVAPPRYTGNLVGFSSLCATNDATYRFLDDVFGELAALTPGPYLHIGGDEASTLSQQNYATIVTRAQEIVARHGKVAVGWHDLANAPLGASTVLQFWRPTSDAEAVIAAANAGHRVIMSPANRAYLDMKYDAHTRIGLSWAGTISVQAAYDWDPARLIRGVDEPAVLGVEAPLWTETVTTVDDIEYMMFPRLAAIAEIGWSPLATHDWSAFRSRLAAQGPRWQALGVDFARADGVAWP
jgi:hexosaminidase